MAPQKPIVVSKPLVAFPQRFKDSQLQKLTIAQLRKLARTFGLDVSRLIDKWEFIHVLIEHRIHGAKPHVENTVDATRRTFFDLPGETRNKVYGYVLVHDGPIIARYDEVSNGQIGNSLSTPLHNLLYGVGFEPPHPSHRRVTQLLRMSWANRELRKEVRGYFFANNTFDVQGSYGASAATFLEKIGVDGRANITTLDLAGTGFWIYNNLFRLCRKLTSLRNLCIYMNLGHLIAFNSYKVVRTCVLQNNPQFEDIPTLVIHESTAFFARFPALQTLEIKCGIPDWENYFSQQAHRREQLSELVTKCVLQGVQNSLQGRGVEVMVAVVSAGSMRLKDDDTGEFL